MRNTNTKGNKVALFCVAIDVLMGLFALAIAWFGHDDSLVPLGIFAFIAAFLIILGTPVKKDHPSEDPMP
jgi:hypothetical protein